MNKKLVFSIILICLLALVAVFAFAQNSPNVRWEYYILESSKNNIELFNRLGAQGWELVSTTDNLHFTMVFKRKLP
jgi:hypothetical protein